MNSMTAETKLRLLCNSVIKHITVNENRTGLELTQTNCDKVNETKSEGKGSRCSQAPRWKEVKESSACTPIVLKDGTACGKGRCCHFNVDKKATNPDDFEV